LSTSARKQATVGEMVNLMQVNTQSFVDLTIYLNMLWSGPLQISISILMLWTHLGVASLAGVAVMIVLIPINIFISNKAKALQAEKLKVQDKRIKQTNEILNGIKVTNFVVWSNAHMLIPIRYHYE
jgi:ATP-binding cassette, subfamily C (CFTR/MRP), member 1